MTCRAALIAVAALALAAPQLAADSPLPAPGQWQRAIGPWPWSFPRDHGAHPSFKTEWWYFTGNLKEEKSGRPFGYQLTIFRQGVQYTPIQKTSKWAVRDFYFGHFTISDIASGQFHVSEKVSRGGELNKAGSAIDDLDVTLGNWSIDREPNGRFNLAADEPDMEILLGGRAPAAGVLQGVDGLSRKSDAPGEASYYYSYPRIDTAGRLRIGDHNYAVSGLTWYDHEFSTSSLSKDEVGWDWFCIQLGDGPVGEEIMLYAMRDKSGAIDSVSEGTWIKADGTSERIMPGTFSIAKQGDWHSPHSGATYPAGWHITIPGHHADLTVTPAMADQELNVTKMGKLAYWEGACTIAGTVAGSPVKGVGYTELTGYAGALKGMQP